MDNKGPFHRYSHKDKNLEIHRPEIHISTAITLSLLALIFTYPIILSLIWRDLPLFPLPDVSLHGGFQAQQGPLWHYFRFWLVWLNPIVSTSPAQEYLSWWQVLIDHNESGRLITRWLIAALGSISLGILTLKASLAPKYQLQQTRGKRLSVDYITSNFKDVKYRYTKSAKYLRAFWEISRVFGKETRFDKKRFSRLPRLVWETSYGFNPTDPSTFEIHKPEDPFEAFIWKLKLSIGLEQKNHIIYLPDTQRRQHILIFGSTRTGKSVKVKKMIKNIEYLYSVGYKYRMVILDVKGEYAEILPPHLCTYISVHDKENSIYDVGRDIINIENAKAFAKGYIPPESGSSNTFFPTAACGLFTGLLVYNQRVNKTDWNLGHLAYWLGRPTAQIAEILAEHYPEIITVIQMAGETVDSVKGTMGSKTQEILSLARIFDGFDIKRGIAQLTVKLLHHEHNIKLLTDEKFPLFVSLAGKEEEHKENFYPGILMRGLLRHMNRSAKKAHTAKTRKGPWKWTELSKLIQNGKPGDNLKLMLTNLSDSDAEELFADNALFTMLRMAQHVLSGKDFNYSAFGPEHFDNFASACYPGTTKLYRNILLGLLRDFHSKKQDYRQAFQDLHDDDSSAKILFKAVRNLSADECNELYPPAEFKTLFFGCQDIFEWAEEWDRIEAQPRFSYREFLNNKSPKKPFLILKSDGEFKELNNGLFRAICTFGAQITDTDDYADGNSSEPNNLWYFIDEFGFFGPMPDFIKPLTERGASRGFTLVLGTQDVTQISDPQNYGEKFTATLLSNTGMIIVTGLNSGDTPDLVANKYIGKMKFVKSHTSTTVQKDGKSTSHNEQEHEELVLTPDELSKLLGTDLANGVSRYLVWGNGMDDAYIFSSPLVSYKTERDNKAMKADWTKGILPVPKKVNIKELYKTVITRKDEDKSGGGGSGGSGEASSSAQEHKATLVVEENDDPIFPDEFDPMAPLVAQTYNGLRDKQAKEQDSIRHATQQEESKTIYTLPTLNQLVEDAENIADDMYQDKMLESVTHSESISAMKMGIEMMDSFRSPQTTTDKTKYQESLDKMKQQQNKISSKPSITLKNDKK